MNIFRWNRWIDIKEDRINSIDVKSFKNLLENNCNANIFLHKKIYEPNFKIGIFQKSKKIVENYYKPSPMFNDEKNWKSFPLRENSLVCYNYEEDSEGKDFLIFPYKKSLFIISPIKESCYDLNINRYNKGYWSDKIQWLDDLDEREMWTDSDCLVIEKDLYDKICEYNDYKDTNYSLEVRNILATTLIGEAGGKEQEMRKVMNVLNNRAKRRKNTPEKEALRPRQFSMWNSAYNKTASKYKLKSEDALKNVIRIHKTSSSWAKIHWEVAYKIADENIKNIISDTTNGATMYYAVKLEKQDKKPYWAKSEKFKETIRTPYHVYGTMN